MKDPGQQLTSVAQSVGGVVKSEKAYPEWTPDRDSRLLRLATDSYSSLFGERPELEVVHAGLECSLFVPKLSGLEAISIGPTIKDPHTPRERVDIASVQRFWEFLVRLLAGLADDVHVPGN